MDLALDHWLSNTLGLNIAEASLLVAVLALLVAVPAAVPAVRSSLRRMAQRVLLWSGTTRRSYTRWFLAQNSKLRNIYLNRIEELDLAQTYVSLAFIAPESEYEQRVRATNVLANTAFKRILLIGDPGTGKSTLLSAYGSGILQRRSQSGRSDLKFIAQSKEIPILVKLRQFAPHADGQASLAKYLAGELLQRQARVSGAREFMYRLLKDHRCLLLLDGLDEVPDKRYQTVRDAIAEFINDDEPSLPTCQARVILTCRRQNFLRIQTDWIPTFCDRSHVLAPLRDADIFSFLIKRQRDFVSPRTPDAFFASIKNSGTVDLHRVPLILTISLGLYLQLAAYEIPRSIAKFYEAMINELLIRHDFRGDQTGSTNRYNAEDKFRFLREFAFTMAQRPDRFEDFTFEEITSFAGTMVPKMSYVRARETDEFVKEIIDRSGLLTRISDEDYYIFAHRSIQEYLIAIKLQRDPPEGARFLLQRAVDSSWRQVALFFSALDHQGVNAFLSELAKLNLELAGYCLAGAGPVADDIAENILSRLIDSILAGNSVAATLSALVAVAGAQKGTVQDLATAALTEVLTSILGRADLIAVLGSDPEGAIRLLHALAETRSSQIAATVPSILGAVSIDDDRVVGILWRSLTADGMEEEASSKIIVNRLLTMVMRESGFEELQRQPAYVPSFLSNEMRRQVYPFRNGVDHDSNLVTLLCWAQHLNAEPDSPNLYLTAMRSDPEAFAEIERDWQRRTYSAKPFYPARIVVVSGLLLALAFAVYKLVINWRELDVRGDWTLSVSLLLAPSLLAAVVAGYLGRKGGKAPRERKISAFAIVNGWHLRHPDEGFHRGANIFTLLLDNYFIALSLEDTIYNDSDIYRFLGSSALITLPYAVSIAILSANLSIVWYLILATAVIWLAFWLPATRACAKEATVYFHRPNRYVDVYEDSQCRHWVLVSGKRTGR